jgi:hypothetical protein
MADYQLAEFLGEGTDACSIYRTKWRRELLSKLNSRGRPMLPNGLLPYILQTDEYIRHVATGANFAELTMPDDISSTASNHASSEFKNKRENYYRQEQEKAMAASKIHDALGETPKRLLYNAQGILETDLKEILLKLDAVYLIVTKREIDEAICALGEKFEPGRDLRALVSKHKAIHAALEDAKEPLSLHFKMNYLIEAVKGVKTLSDCVDGYMQGQPDRSQHSFDALAAALNAHIANRPETVFSLGYANAATNNNLASEVEELKKINRELMARLSAVEARPRDDRKSPAGDRHLFYCWSHGCRLPRGSGHQRQATFQNQMGGKKAVL